MSETRYYNVTQEREVKVAAGSAIDAAAIATIAFENAANIEEVHVDLPNTNTEGYTTTEVRIRDLVVREDY